ncbi:TPA: hypothetical protein N0F65_000482 [Lagenidium giganteum]|uniref:YrhK domain-containing protein n=1 Tax=Lagenidium giganteum TaxID=4803 RepID=A0AAV2YY49_9STRA|nr:TPA: hypothetical protein N0F65_000482 [Lagenidium giganteum]
MSPRALSPAYSMQDTPDVKNSMMAPLVLTRGEKLFKIAKVGSCITGSVLFMIGSVMFYPKYYVLWDNKGGLIASWTFLIGCVFFLLATNGHFIDTIRYNSGSSVRRILNAYNAMMYVTAAAVFQLGAIYFLPDYYALAPSLGCWAFIIGCVQFCIAAIVDIIFIGITHADPKRKGFSTANLHCWGTVAAIGTFLGGIFFVLGSYYYLPKFVAVEDAALATSNSNKAVNYFVIGCVFFIINGLAQIPDVLVQFRASNEAAFSHKSKANADLV